MIYCYYRIWFCHRYCSSFK